MTSVVTTKSRLLEAADATGSVRLVQPGDPNKHFINTISDLSAEQRAKVLGLNAATFLTAQRNLVSGV